MVSVPRPFCDNRGRFKAPLELRVVLGNPNMTILGLTKSKYNDPRDLSYYYC